MSPKERSEKLVKQYAAFVNGYVGSSMLTNTEYPETILSNSQKCATICVDIILNDVGAKDWDFDVMTDSNYWSDVKNEIQKTTIETILCELIK